MRKIKVSMFLENWKFIKGGGSVYATREFVPFINKPYKAKVQAGMSRLSRVDIV